MPLAVGARIAHYEVTGSLGAGGMGEVYRARDTKLVRDVALKILPDAFASDAERRARFGREAKTLAALNHPNIAQVHGFEESGATSALVMELVEGEDLSQRIRRGPLPYDEAIAIAKQIAQALEAAHDQGIVHRDLKPGNIKVRDDGTVKVLDFGLAKALEPAVARADSGAEIMNSPTITSPAGVTLGGVIIGTAAYMAPEQARGRVVDKRADIWAFGCVLYEMLSGRRAFAGEDVSDTLASVLKSDVEWTGIPRAATRLLKKCLEKDPKKRLHDIGDAWDLIDDGTPWTPAAPPSRLWVPWAIAALVLLASTIGLAVLHFTEAPVTPASARFQIAPPPKTGFDIYLALSPDGRRLAFTARDEKGVLQLWVRDLESLEARPLPGTEGAWSPFWSPDSRFLAFAVERTLKKIDVTGGPPQTIGDAAATVGMGAWSPDGAIVFGTRGAGPLRKVPASGGSPENLTSVDASAGETFHAFPFFLPDGRHFLYFRQSLDPEVQGVYAGSLDLAPDQQSRTRLTHATMGPIYTAGGDTGRLLFLRNATLMAQAFDPASLRVTGEPTPVVERVGSSGSFGYFSASSTDVLAYRTGSATAPNLNQLTWMNRKGQTIETVAEPGNYTNSANALALSPDARHAIVAISPTPSADLWLLEFARAIQTRLTSHEAADVSPVWSPDGTSAVFRSNRPGPGSVYVKDINGNADESVLFPSTQRFTPTDWSHDGRFVSLTRDTLDLWVLPLEGTKVPMPLLETRFNETAARWSPDDRWLAYASDETGENEVYLRPFAVAADGKPGLGTKWRVSTDGGAQPRWRRDGKELFYRNGAGAVMAVDVTALNGKVQTGLPHQLFIPSPLSTVGWDVAPDGQRFLFSLPVDQAVNADPITVVLNWQAGK